MLATYVNAEPAMDLLEYRCHACHGLDRESDPNFDVTDFRYITNPATGLIVPGKPDASRIVQRIESGEMPPPPAPPLSTADTATIRRWIADGALYEKPDRVWIDDHYVSAAIGLDVLRAGRAEARHYRYLSLVNLHNDGAGQPEIITVHAAIDKAMNSLSWMPQVARPTVLDQLGMVVRIDLRSYGWTADDWRAVLDGYPYRRTSNIVMRADAFLASITVPKLYYLLLDIPPTELMLEAKLGVDRNTRSVRAGITDSTLAHTNRMLHRRVSDHGYYWRVLNVLDDETSTSQNVLRTPINFQHDYALVLFSLPNKYIGYAVFITTPNRRDGERLDSVPIRAETDPDRVSGTHAIVPAVSCMACHDQGVQVNVRDVVRSGAVVESQDELTRLLQMFPPQNELSRILLNDRDRFLEVAGVPEPVKPTLLQYNRPLTLRRAANEVGLEDDNVLARLIRNNRALQAAGLRPLAEGRTVTRRAWASGPARQVAQLVED
jgi:hypothetical protein